MNVSKPTDIFATVRRFTSFYIKFKTATVLKYTLNKINGIFNELIMTCYIFLMTVMGNF